MQFSAWFESLISSAQLQIAGDNDVHLKWFSCCLPMLQVFKSTMQQPSIDGHELQVMPV